MNETIITATVKLRAVQPKDEEFLISVYASSREQELAMVPWTDEQRYVFAKFQYQAQLNYYQTEFPSSEHSIILSEGEPVGRLFIDRREAQIRILDITILARHRGKGIGKPIIRHVMDLAAVAGKSVGINLDLFSTSQQTFEGLGFKPTEKTDSHTLYVWLSAEQVRATPAND